jgi:hypothetical protein|tara:strand:+ start:272 stop:445 length:174 start_codon:yes stop_codon:yes gene_type:complete
MARKSYEHIADEEDDVSTSKKSLERDQTRKQQRKIKNALKSKDLNYLLELDDMGDDY